jgi:hypothetical protein
VLDVSFPPRKVDAVQVIVPPGPSGLVGWCVMNSRLRVIPYQSDPWIITAGESITWPLSRQITSGDWQVAGYNTGANDHSVYFRFLLDLIDTKSAPEPTTLDESDLTAADFTLFDYTGG